VFLIHFSFTPVRRSAVNHKAVVVGYNSLLSNDADVLRQCRAELHSTAAAVVFSQTQLCRD